jgi:hypothetical protein
MQLIGSELSAWSTWQGLEITQNQWEAKESHARPGVRPVGLNSTE